MNMDGKKMRKMDKEGEECGIGKDEGRMGWMGERREVEREDGEGYGGLGSRKRQKKK